MPIMTGARDVAFEFFRNFPRDFGLFVASIVICKIPLDVFILCWILTDLFVKQHGSSLRITGIMAGKPGVVPNRTAMEER